MQVEQVIDQLRRVGYRITAQRSALLETLWAMEGHFTAEQLREAVAAQEVSADLSTIYRLLDLLCQLGVLHALLGSSPTEYERVREPHHHLVCEGCGKVTALATDHFDALLHHLLEEHGFLAAFHHLAIPGFCRRCHAEGA